MKVLDNNYGKLKSFVEAWLYDFEQVEIYEKPKLLQLWFFCGIN